MIMCDCNKCTIVKTMAKKTVCNIGATNIRMYSKTHHVDLVMVAAKYFL